MTREDTNITCPPCGNVVYHAEKVMFLGRLWHRSCLRCVKCNKVIDSTRVCANEGKPYCPRPCYISLYSTEDNPSIIYNNLTSELKLIADLDDFRTQNEVKACEIERLGNILKQIRMEHEEMKKAINSLQYNSYQDHRDLRTELDKVKCFYSSMNKQMNDMNDLINMNSSSNSSGTQSADAVQLLESSATEVPMEWKAQTPPSLKRKYPDSSRPERMDSKRSRYGYLPEAIVNELFRLEYERYLFEKFLYDHFQ